MPAKRLEEYLDSHNVKYERIAHHEAYTAQEIAATSHVPGKELAKTVILKIDGSLAMAVLPAPSKIDLGLMKKEIGANSVELAKEDEFKDFFPGCDVGAMPPFGNLYGLTVYVAEKLTEDKEIAFNAGSHIELIKISFKDYVELVKPRIIKIIAT
jgi:Ala-tRNA(Pro) deacylase